MTPYSSFAGSAGGGGSIGCGSGPRVKPGDSAGSATETERNQYPVIWMRANAAVWFCILKSRQAQPHSCRLDAGKCRDLRSRVQGRIRGQKTGTGSNMARIGELSA